jgi:hypothetical protein
MKLQGNQTINQNNEYNIFSSNQMKLKNTHTHTQTALVTAWISTEPFFFDSASEPLFQEQLNF